MTRTPLRYALAVCVLSFVSFYSAKSQTGLIAVRGAAPDEAAQSDVDNVDLYQASAKNLAGYVHIASQENTALAMVLIEETDPGWNKVLGSTRTDYQGYFKLKPARRGKQHYLRLSAQGFSTRMYEVTLSKDAPAQLKLELGLPSKSQAVPAKPAPTRSFMACIPAPRRNGPA